MTMRKHLFCLALAGCILFPLTNVQAEPGESCGEAVSGTVPEVEGYCDIYARQLEYKKAAKEFRESLEARRVSYEAPRIEALELYRQNLEELYKEESKEYQEELASIEDTVMDGSMSKDDMSMDEGMMSDDDTMSDDSAWDDMDSSSSDDTSMNDQEKMAEAPESSDGTSNEQSEGGLKEKQVQDSESGTRKKVIMPEDAPDFDGSPF